MNTAFFWVLSNVDEIHEFLLIDRFLFRNERTINGETFLPSEWPDPAYARQRAIESTAHVERRGLTLDRPPVTYEVDYTEEDLMGICDDSDALSVARMIAWADTRGKALM